MLVNLKSKQLNAMNDLTFVSCGKSDTRLGIYDDFESYEFMILTNRIDWSSLI
jgi:hypothetical protein